MGNSESNSNKEGENSRVEYVSLGAVFDEMCPIYMSFGMTYNEFWFGDPWLTKYYREAYELKMKHYDEGYWRQGMYIYEALCEVSPILHPFSKSTKPLPYAEKPYSYIKSSDEMPQEDLEQKKKNDRLIARVFFERWARDTAKHFENKQ